MSSRSLIISTDFHFRPVPPVSKHPLQAWTLSPFLDWRWSACDPLWQFGQSFRSKVAHTMALFSTSEPFEPLKNNYQVVIIKQAHQTIPRKNIIRMCHFSLTYLCVPVKINKGTQFCSLKMSVSNSCPSWTRAPCTGVKIYVVLTPVCGQIA